MFDHLFLWRDLARLAGTVVAYGGCTVTRAERVTTCSGVTGCGCGGGQFWRETFSQEDPRAAWASRTCLNLPGGARAELHT